jgi:cysteine desulfurase / selenocysteine lyase
MTTLTALATSYDSSAIRSQFPVLNRELKPGLLPVYLDSGASAQKPSVVIEKEREVEEQYFANAYRGRYTFGARIDDELEASRTTIASFINAPASTDVVFTPGTTIGLNMIAFGWGRKFVGKGDEILISLMEHHANYVPWQQLAKERGATLRFFPLTQDGRLDMSQLDDVVGPRTKVVALCSMSNVLGTVNPIAEIVRAAHRHDACVVVDAAQSVPHITTDVQSDEVDFLVFSGHKLYGPTGIGVLYGRPERLLEMEPIIFGGHMIQRVMKFDSEWAEPPARFEAGTLPIVQAIALGTAVRWVQEIGLDNIHQHETQLAEVAMESLSKIPGMQIFGPSLEHRGAIISFRIEGLHPEDLAAMLDRKGVFTRHGHHCAMPLHDELQVTATTRVSFGAYNTLDDVASLVNAIQFARQKMRLV